MPFCGPLIVPRRVFNPSVCLAVNENSLLALRLFPEILMHCMSGLVELEGNFSAYLARLHSLLDPGNLPVALPLHDEATKSIYGTFLHFTLDPDTLEKTGDEVGAFSEQMKAIFGWKTHSTGDGIIPIEERGRALSAAIDVLSQFHEKHPNNAVVQK